VVLLTPTGMMMVICGHSVGAMVICDQLVVAGTVSVVVAEPDDTRIVETEEEMMVGTVVGILVSVVATTVADVVPGPYEVDVDAEAIGVTVVDIADNAMLVAVVPGPVLVVIVSDVVTTTVANWSQ